MPNPKTAERAHRSRAARLRMDLAAARALLAEGYTGTNSHGLARALGVDHGDAVRLAREFCPSGYEAGAHGSTCPCYPCTVIAVKMLTRGRVTLR